MVQHLQIRDWLNLQDLKKTDLRESISVSCPVYLFNFSSTCILFSHKVNTQNILSISMVLTMCWIRKTIWRCDWSFPEVWGQIARDSIPVWAERGVAETVDMVCTMCEMWEATRNLCWTGFYEPEMCSVWSTRFSSSTEHVNFQHCFPLRYFVF